MKNLDYLFILICTYLGRIIIFGSNLPEALVFVACMSYILINKYLEYNKIEKYNEDVNEKINKLQEDLTRTHDSVSALKVGSSYSNIKR